jgi:hypothetical protein
MISALRRTESAAHELICAFSLLMKRYIPYPPIWPRLCLISPETPSYIHNFEPIKRFNAFPTAFWASANVPWAKELFQDCSSRTIFRTLTNPLLNTCPGGIIPLGSLCDTPWRCPRGQVCTALRSLGTVRAICRGHTHTDQIERCILAGSLECELRQ